VKVSHDDCIVTSPPLAEALQKLLEYEQFAPYLRDRELFC
jgi:hypothetical protein